MTDKYLNTLLVLNELGIPPAKAASLIQTVPLDEIKDTILDAIEDNATLGNLCDRLAYRDIPIRNAFSDIYWRK